MAPSASMQIRLDSDRTQSRLCSGVFIPLVLWYSWHLGTSWYLDVFKWMCFSVRTNSACWLDPSNKFLTVPTKMKTTSESIPEALHGSARVNKGKDLQGVKRKAAKHKTQLHIAAVEVMTFLYCEKNVPRMGSIHGFKEFREVSMTRPITSWFKLLSNYRMRSQGQEILKNSGVERAKEVNQRDVAHYEFRPNESTLYYQREVWMRNFRVTNF